MKLLNIAIAAAVAIGAAGAANADRVVVHRHTTVVTHHNVHPARHQVCNTRWEHHHKVRHCWWR